MVISTRQKFLAENCSEINIQLDGHPICRVEHAKSLGLIIDDRLSIVQSRQRTMQKNILGNRRSEAH